MNFKLNLIIILLIAKSYNEEQILIKSSSYKLYNNLFNGYNKKIRSVINRETTTNVNASFVLLNIISMNDQEETLEVNGYLDLHWIDEGLNWDPSDYNNLTQIDVESTEIWQPDMIVYSAANQDSWDRWSKITTIAKIFNDGHCYLSTPALIKTYCQLNIMNFPFDEKKCQIKFGSWMHTNKSINLSCTPQIFLDKFVPNNAWDLYQTSQFITNEIFENDESFSIFVVQLHFKRRTLFFLFNYIIPSIVLTICSIFGFMLPPQSGEKISLQMTNLLTIVFFLENVANIVPHSSLGVAKISIYFLIISVLCMLSLIGNIYVLHIHHRDARINKEMSKLFEKVVCVYLARFLKMKNMNFEELLDENEIDDVDSSNLFSNCIFVQSYPLKLIEKISILEFKISKIKKEIIYMKKNQLKELKWKYAAVVFDRFFLVISSSLFTITFLSLILTA